MSHPKKLINITSQLKELPKVELIKVILHQYMRLHMLEAQLLPPKERTGGQHFAGRPITDNKPAQPYCIISYLLTEPQVEKHYHIDDKHNLLSLPCPIVNATLNTPQKIEQPAKSVTDRQHKLEKATRQALRRLEDVAYLGRSTLAIILAKIHQKQLDGWAIQQMLQQAITAIAPTKNDPNYGQQHLRYRLLQLAYLEKVPLTEIIKQVALSERQYYRELKAAIQTVVAYLVQVNQ